MENHAKNHAKTMDNPWKTMQKTCKNYGKHSENHAQTMENPCNTMQKVWKTHGKQCKINGTPIKIA